LTPQEQKRLGELLAMGIPLPLALAALNEDPKDIQREVVRVSEMLRPTNILEQLGLMSSPITPKKKPRMTKKRRNYAKAFKKVQNKYKLKSGKWKKDGFKRAVKEAHKLAKKMK
jgi:hypothetical protein